MLSSKTVRGSKTTRTILIFNKRYYPEAFESTYLWQVGGGYAERAQDTVEGDVRYHET